MLMGSSITNAIGRNNIQYKLHNILMHFYRTHLTLLQLLFGLHMGVGWPIHEAKEGGLNNRNISENCLLFQNTNCYEASHLMYMFQSQKVTNEVYQFGTEIYR